MLNNLQEATAIQPTEKPRATVLQEEEAATASRAILDKEEEATSDEDCPEVQARRREAIHRRFLGLDLYKPPDAFRGIKF